MSLRGQGESGYAMAALLVALAVMAVMMSVALPVWRHEAQRQKEDELIWRGNQYVRAIRLYQAKLGTLPPSVDALVQGHFLRKPYKDPITKDDFDLLGAGATQPGLAPGQGQAQPGRPGQPVQPQATTTLSTAPTTQQPTGMAAIGGTVPGGMTGVRSKSKDESIKIYQGRTHYNEWTFIFAGQQPGIGGPGRGQPGRGQPGRGQPGQRGAPPPVPNPNPIIRRPGGL